MTITDKYVLFWGEDIFSNFSPHSIKLFDINFKTGEHYYQWRKAMFFGDLENADHIVNASSPAMAKKFGRKIRGFNEARWSKARNQVMLDVLRDKVANNPEVRSRLLELGEHRTFVEASPHDTLWGIGFSEKEAIGDEQQWGSNLLGKCWNIIYKEISGKVSSNIYKGQYEMKFE